MAREIKFRAWNKIADFMMQWESFEVYAQDQRAIVGEYSVFADSEFEVLQYTGLKDKNGREIYEGDIVTGINRLHDFKSEQNVHFLNGCFMFGNWNAHEFFNKHQFIEVIGNIYENPKLLEEGHE